MDAILRLGLRWVLAQLALLALFFFCPGHAVHWSLLGISMLTLGAALLVTASLALGRSLSPFPAPVKHGILITRGVFSSIRHPIYSGIVSVALALAIMTGSPWRGAVSLILAFFFDAKARAEELLLAQTYPSYGAYAAKTRKFIPWIY
ncbi:MAG: isoprenylcysteine carboxylmethyltransferase family protein [Vulcanimicrobiaceae bacterium]